MLIVTIIAVAAIAYTVGWAEGYQRAERDNQGSKPRHLKIEDLVEIQTPPLERQGLRLVGGRDCPWLDPIPGNYE